MRSTINGEDIENFTTLACFVCEKDMGIYCLTDSYIGITAVCETCLSKADTK